MRFPPLMAAAALLPAACAMSLSGCRKPDLIEVTQARALFADEPAPLFGLTDHERFAEDNVTQRLLSWDKPEGWVLLPATEFRDLNFAFGAAREGECYVSAVSASRGGVPDNFNRWRKQMGMTELSDEEVMQLPEKPFLGRRAKVMDLSGTYTAAAGPMTMAGATPKPGWRLIGIIFEAPGAIFTVKMTGPQALVEQHKASLDRFCQSLRPGPHARF